jgi:hypothetical protein
VQTLSGPRSRGRVEDGTAFYLKSSLHSSIAFNLLVKVVLLLACGLRLAPQRLGVKPEDAMILTLVVQQTAATVICECLGAECL